nr:immunoglobulin light chain junction region [Mus musculus]NSM01547.1 immunoglobulin light chain junction region [Mus musculus]
CWQGTHLLTF